MSNFNLEKLFQCPEYRVVREDNGIKEIFYENEPYHGRKTEVFAYLGVPEHMNGPVPGMICIHGGGGKAFKEWVELWMARGYAAISMDFGGKGPDGNTHAASGPDQTHVEKFGDLAWENIWTYHAVCAVVRAHSILRSLPEVDAERTGMTGISWGGYLTCCTSGIDDRFKLAVPVYGCGYLQDNSAEDWLKIFAAMPPERKKWWHDNCDPSVYLKEAKMPMLFVTGTNDFAYPPDSLRKSGLTPRGRVQACIRLEMPHGHEPGWNPKEIGIYADSILRNGISLPSISDVSRDENKVSSEYTSELPVKGYLLYTCDGGIWTERKWHQVEASVTDGRVAAELPSGVTAFILALEDERGAYISTLPEIFS